MSSLDQLSQMVKNHLGVHSSHKWFIGESQVSGRGLIAAEDISPGEVLFIDHPLIYGPRSGVDLPRGCTVCCKLDSDMFFKCSRCALLLCSEECQSTCIHNDDCNIISRWENKIPMEEVDDTIMSRALTVIRALLLKEDRFRFMASLCGHEDPKHGFEVKHLKEYFNIPEHEEKIMLLASYVMDTNAFQVASPYGKKEMDTKGLFPVSALLNSTCVPNIRYNFNSEREMIVKATKPIPTGTEIFTCYTGILWGTPARQVYLRKTKHFLCRCDRCADPTERGTMLAALKCFATECPGSLLPLEPLIPTSPWGCLECGMRVPSKNIFAVQNALGSMLASLNFKDVDDLEHFLLNRIKKFIPKTNQIVVDLQCRLIYGIHDIRHPVNRGAFYRHTMLAKSALKSALQVDRIEALQNHLSQNEENKFCDSWEIKNSRIGGRGLFATKAIPQGTLIFINRPLVIAPRADCAEDNFCSYCYKQRDCYPCKQCSLPVCSEECLTTKKHNRECNFISDNWKLKSNYTTDSSILRKILIHLRILMLNEEQFKIISILQSDIERPVFEELDNLCSRYEIPVAQIEIMRVMDTVLKRNAFRISNNSDKRKVSLRGLYPLSSLMNHNCVPNTRNVFRKDYSMAVYASKSIEIGEEIFTCYTGQLWCTAARRCHLYKTKKFWCKCARCGDNTEMGTNLSALKCLSKNCSGVILPLVPLNPNTEWYCDCCGVIELPEKVRVVQSVLGSLVGTLNLDGKMQLECPVLNRLHQFVPNSNHILVDLQLRLAYNLENSEGVQINDLSESRLSLKENLCRGILRIVAALGLGDAHQRGLLLYHLHATLAERARRSPDLYEELKSEIESTIEQAYKILQDDISAPADLELRRQYLGPDSNKPPGERFFFFDC